jgi:nitrogen regulatory protein P-II 1
MFKKIKAMIEPLHLDEVKEALEELGIKGVTISKCKKLGAQTGPAMIFRGRKQATDCLSEIRLEMVVDQEMAARVIETIQKADGGGRDKEGKISVLPIEEVISIDASECASYPVWG